MSTALAAIGLGTVTVLLLAAIVLTLLHGDRLRREQKAAGLANGWETNRRPE